MLELMHVYIYSSMCQTCVYVLSVVAGNLVKSAIFSIHAHLVITEVRQFFGSQFYVICL